MKRLAAKSIKIPGIFITICGCLLVLDGLLPMRSHGPNPSWGEITLGIMVSIPGSVIWLLTCLLR